MAEKVDKSNRDGLLSCPGEGGSKCATMELVVCKNCGTENEMFSDEGSVVCENCKEIVKRDER